MIEYIVKGGIDMSELQDRIVTYRAKNGISQTEFAKLCGVSYQTINSIENGRQDPSRITKKKIELVLEGK
jgi:DNA-binding XRE family transcriptional regulator